MSLTSPVAKIGGGAAALALVVGAGGMTLLGPKEFAAALSSVLGPKVIDDGSPAWVAKAQDPAWRQRATKICAEVEQAVDSVTSDANLAETRRTGGLLAESAYDALADIERSSRFPEAYDKAGFSENERKIADRMCLFHKLAQREMVGLLLNNMSNPEEFRPGYADPGYVSDGTMDQSLGKRFYEEYGFGDAVKNGKLDYASWSILPEEGQVTTAMSERLDNALIRDGWNRKSHQALVRALRYAYDVAIARESQNRVRPVDTDKLQKIGEAAQARGDFP